MRESFSEAAELIWECWHGGAVIEALPDPLRPMSRAEGYAIQHHFETFSGKPLFGWKIAATSIAGQKHIGVSGPLAGRLLQERVFEAGSVLDFGANRMAVAEPEFAFKMAKTIAPRAEPYTQDEVMEAVASLHPGIEVPDSRFEDFVTAGEAQLIADNACAHQFVIGEAMPESWLSIDLSKHETQISTKNEITGELLSHNGVGANVLGDPRIALTWLVNELSSHKITLKVGMVVTTGTSAVPIPIKAGDRVKADYGALGSLSFSFAA